MKGMPHPWMLAPRHMDKLLHQVELAILSDEESVPDLIHFDTDSDDNESVIDDVDSILMAGASQAGEGLIPSESNTMSLDTIPFKVAVPLDDSTFHESGKAAASSGASSSSSKRIAAPSGASAAITSSLFSSNTKDFP